MCVCEYVCVNVCVVAAFQMLSICVQLFRSLEALHSFVAQSLQAVLASNLELRAVYLDGRSTSHPVFSQTAVRNAVQQVEVASAAETRGRTVCQAAATQKLI